LPISLIDNIAASTPEGRDARIPDAFLNSARVYFTSWINGGRGQPPLRFHWDRLAVNPHNVGGAMMPPSAAPSFCLGQPFNTCPAPSSGPTMTPMPSGTAMATMPTPSDTPTPAPATATLAPATRTPTPGGAGGSSVGTYTCTEVVGFSQTMQWYFGGPGYPTFTSIAGPGRWQLRWEGGAAIDSWADPNFSGWGPAAQVNSCDQGSSNPDRVLLNITG